MAGSTTNDLRTADDFIDEGSDRSFTDQFDLQHYLRILRKHKLPITLFTAAITALAAYYAYTATPHYKSTATLLIESQATNVPSIEELVTGDTEGDNYYQTQFEILKSRALATRIVNNMGLWNHPELSPQARADLSRKEAAEREIIGAESTESDGFLTNITSFFNRTFGADDFQSQTVVEESSAVFPTSTEQVALTDDLNKDQQRVIGAFMNRLTVVPVRKTKLVRISFESTDRDFSADVANRVGKEYIESYLDDKLERTASAATFLNSRLLELKATLDGSKSRLISFKEENGLVDVDGSVGRLNEQTLLLSTAELTSARSDLSRQQSIYNEVQSLVGRSDLLESIPSIQADALVQRTKIEQGQAQRNLDELLNRYGERHPRVVDATSQLSTLNITLEGHIRRVVGTIANDYQLARSRVASIETKLNAGKREIQAIGSKQFELDELQNEVDTNQAIYDAFYNQITQAKSADGLESANATISDFAVPANRPFKPKKQLIIALAALGSLILSILMAFLYEQLDDTVKSTSDVEDKIGQRLLGILPMVKNTAVTRDKSKPVNPMWLAKGAANTKGKSKKDIAKFFEAVDTARTAICLGDYDCDNKIIMVTSSVPGEGKSTTSLNLAYSFAKIERVLLIDCDLRKPTVARAVIDNAKARAAQPGLSELIAGQAPASDCIIRGAFDQNLDILPSGQLPENPLELLSSMRFRKILESLRTHYDRIVLDCAPIQVVSDAIVLGRVSDTIAYCIESQETSIDVAKRGIERLRQSGAHVGGVLVTQVDMDRIVAYGGDYYYQGMYDYYGYSENTEKGQPDRGKLKLSQKQLQKIQTDESNVELDIGYSGDSTQAYHPSEFDMTAQVELNGMAKPMIHASAKKRMRDDLDFL